MIKMCKNCEFLETIHGTNVCTRFPPTALLTSAKNPLNGQPMMGMIGAFPPVDIEKNRCGEFCAKVVTNV